MEEETITPWIGKKDGNGKKIFEGDVVRMTFSPEYLGFSTTSEEYLLVYWDERFSGFLCKSDQSSIPTEADSLDLQEDGCAVEIIGNIFDNPELMEKFCRKK